jgi:hypothetical protein
VVSTVNWSRGRAAEGTGIGEEDSTGAGGEQRALEPKKCVRAPEERTTVQ